jgi:hypothetical protein
VTPRLLMHTCTVALLGPRLTALLQPLAEILSLSTMYQHDPFHYVLPCSTEVRAVDGCPSCPATAVERRLLYTLADHSFHVPLIGTSTACL